jgi:hypothetical protein
VRRRAPILDLPKIADRSELEMNEDPGVNERLVSGHNRTSGGGVVAPTSSWFVRHLERMSISLLH